MRSIVATSCMILVLLGTPLRAEPLRDIASGLPDDVDEGRAARLRRAYLLPSLHSRLVQFEGEGEAMAADGAGDVDARIADLEARRSGISRRLPIFGIVAGHIMVVAGAATLVGISMSCRETSWEGDPPETNCHGGSVDGKWAAGGIVLGAGVVLAGVSVWTLAKRIGEGRAIRREILELQRGRRARVAPSWYVGFDAGESKALHFSLRF